MKYVKAKNLGYDEAQTVLIRIDNDEFIHIEICLKRIWKIHPVSYLFPECPANRVVFSICFDLKQKVKMTKYLNSGLNLQILNL